MNRFKSSVLLAFLFAFFISTGAISQVTEPPTHQQVLGAATYVTMPLHKLKKPTLLWADFEFLQTRGFQKHQILEKFGVASPVEGESNAAFLSEFITAFVDGNGGIGMNENFGSGRAAIILKDWQIKGSGKTIMVNPNADGSHRNGASFIAEGIHEAIWSKLLAYELPYGAFRTVAVIATGSDIAGEPRALIVREDPLRPGHYVINPTAEELGHASDAARVKEAMKHLLEALPKPPGPLPKKLSERFKAQVYEFIDRQAVQHGYSWTHSLFHGATSPSNAGMDGRMIDFGTYSAFDGYPRARIIDEDGFFGETALYKRDLLKNVRDSWVRTLPRNLLAGLPSEEEWFKRFEDKFQETRQAEMLRLAGAFTELTEALMNHAEGQRLGKILIQIAELGNDKKIEIWEGQSPFNTGTYNLGKILNAAASVQLKNFNSEIPALVKALPNDTLRKKFSALYLTVFSVQQTLAYEKGISISAESNYRKFSTRIRNKKMKTVFRKVENEKKIWALVDNYKETGDAAPIQAHIDRTVAENRREFRDAAPFSIVLEETTENQKTQRKVFNAFSNLTTIISSGEQPGLCSALSLQ